MSVSYVFDPGGPNEYTLTDSDIDAGAGHNPIRTHTGKSDCSATFAYDRTLEGFAQRQDRVNVSIDGSVEFTGYVIDCQHDDRQATTRIRIDGIEKRLEETRPDSAVTYSQIALEDAIEDYWDRTEFSNHSVTAQNTDSVVTDEQIQSADTTTEWQNITTIADDVPVEAQNSELELLQSNYLSEGEDTTTESGVTQSDVADYSDGFALRFDANGESATWDFTTDYDLPESAVSFYVRDNGSDTPEIKFRIDGSTVDTLSQGVSNLSLGWTDVGNGDYSGGSGYGGGTLSAGSHTLEIECTADPSTTDGFYDADVVCLLDNRFSYNFDNTTDSNDQLAGPELFPDSQQLTLDAIDVSYNLTAGDINSTWTDTSGSQALALSNDGGSTFTSASNTETLSVSFSDSGRTAQARFTLSRFGTQSTTPTEGANGQAVTTGDSNLDYELRVDGNDLVVIDEMELTRSHFQNLQTLHNYGDFLYVVEHGSESLGNLPVTSFQRGDETRTKPSGFDTQANKQPEVQAEAYYNTIYLEGAEQSDGTRPTAEVKDSDAINDDGREISPGVLRDHTINTDAGAAYRARALLQAALQNSELKGSVTVAPTVVDPGYARPVDFGDGEVNKTVEEVSLRETGSNVEATFDFVVRPGFATEIDDLKRNASSLQNQV